MTGKFLAIEAVTRLGVDRLAAAILRGYYYEEPQPWQKDLDNRVEWYASPREMASAILVALAEADQVTE